MKVQSILMLFAFYGALVLVSTQMRFGSYLQRPDSDYYCGRKLSTALAVLCNGYLVKRSSMANIASNWPLISYQEAHALGRSKRQVVAECCEKPCTREELLSYCG